jgi:hypothetical protein
VRGRQSPDRGSSLERRPCRAWLLPRPCGRRLGGPKLVLIRWGCFWSSIRGSASAVRPRSPRQPCCDRLGGGALGRFCVSSLPEVSSPDPSRPVITLPPRRLASRPQGSYLVDPASSHMLVSKIKPCMSKYKQLYGETANGSLNQL